MNEEKANESIQKQLKNSSDILPQNVIHKSAQLFTTRNVMNSRKKQKPSSPPLILPSCHYFFSRDQIRYRKSSKTEKKSQNDSLLYCNKWILEDHRKHLPKSGASFKATLQFPVRHHCCRSSFLVTFPISSR